jgi:hypothetical protein
MVAVAHPWDKVRDEADQSYPTHLLPDCETALVLFAAAWHGRQDAVFCADAGLTATCVDLDDLRLDEMARLYPDDWTFVCADACDFAEQTSGQWDIVSLDCFTNDFRRCAELLPLWCDLARKVVVLGTGPGVALSVPDGWRLSGLRHRSDFAGGVYWAVLERAC